jgi:hypothetical protein
MNQAPRVAFLSALVVLGGAGCRFANDDDTPVAGEEDLVADASFSLETAGDCVAAFDTRPFLSLVASRRGWDETDIQSFCASLETIKNAYVNDATFTTVTVAGGGRLEGDALTGSYYIGVTGYDLTEIRRFISGVVEDGVVRRCMRRTVVQRTLGPRPSGFVVDCLEELSGLEFPNPLFQYRLSDVGVGELADARASAGINVAMIRVPGVGVVAGVLGGAFYAQNDPVYGAFLGCGTLIGISTTGAAAVPGPVCLGAEFVDVAAP